jgi:hypothetical protein
MEVVVVMVSVDVPELLAIVGRVNAQLAPLGKPAHERRTVELKPKIGLTVTVEVAESAGVTVAGDNALADNSKPGGVVLNNTPTPIGP